MAPNASARRDRSAANPIHKRISRWLGCTLIKSLSNRRTPPPPPPLLSPRRRPITPSDSPPSHAQDQCPFFSRLPPEIRRVIMLYAFGNRTLHMNLSLDHPTLETAKVSRTGRAAHGGFTWKKDHSAPRQWLWRSSVCHRNPPWTPPQHLWWRVFWLRPDADRCTEGDGFACNSWLGEWPVKCQVGALGWLLSCRKAYDEGIGILYMTNTFHISGDHLLARLPDYILPGRLAQMSSFDIVTSLTGSTDQVHLQPACATLPPLLTMLARRSGIRRLFLCLLCPHLWDCVVDVHMTNILYAVDAFVLTSETESTVLQVNSTALAVLATNAGSLEEEGARSTQSDYSYQLWRCLDGDKGQVKMEKRICLYPEVRAPLQDVIAPELGQSRGYWILSSSEEAPYVCNVP